MMWVSFAFALLICIALVYLPGALQLKALNLNGPSLIAMAPILSVFEIVVLGIAFGCMGVVGVFPILCSLILLTVVVFFVGKSLSRIEFKPAPNTSWKSLLLYFAVGILLGAWYFVWNLDGPASFVQEFDNSYHLNLIAKFIDSGIFSPLQASIFGNGMSYYPAAFHVVAALAGSLVGAGASIAENAAIFVFAFMVFSGSCCLFLTVLFKGKQLPVFAGSLIMLAFSAFPWGFLVAGPLYPNMASLSILPALMAFFILVLEECDNRKKAVYVAVFFLALVCEAFSQPNTIFTAIVILAPLLAMNIYQKFSDRKLGLLASSAFIVLVVVFLAACYNAPFMVSVTHYKCVPYAGTAYQAAIDFMDFGYRNSVAQPVLSLLVFFGILVLLAKRQLRWILLSLAYFFIGYVFAGYSGGSFLTGFWYNDVDRVAANAVMLLIPLAAVGLATLLKVVVSLVEQGIGPVSQRWCSIAVLSIVLLSIFCPSYINAGNGYVNTAFGDRASRLEELAKSAVSLTGEEKDFLQNCKNYLGESVVLNNPYDGSVFAYSICGLKTEYTQFFSKSDEAHREVQHGLYEYASDPAVKEAIESMGVRYYLSLDKEADSNATFYDAFFKKEEWDGMLSVNDSTPGFEIVFSCGDMRLYRLSLL